MFKIPVDTTLNNATRDGDIINASERFIGYNQRQRNNLN